MIYRNKRFTNKQFASLLREAKKQGVKTNADLNRFLGV